MSEDSLPLPDFVAWPTFPFEGDLRVRPLEGAAPVEPPRDGEDPSECHACGAPDQAYVWVNDRWRVRSLDRPTGLPVVLILESRSHFDLGDLPNMLAAELGVMTVRLERAIRSLDGVARVHVNRWGDDSAHLHLWFLARPYGHLQLRGAFLSLWDEILPPIPEYQWRENLALVAAWLGDFDGRPLAEPPHLDWKSPATLTSVPPSFTAGDDARDRLRGDVGDGAEELLGSHVTPIVGSLTDEHAGAIAGGAVTAGTGEASTGDLTTGRSPEPGGTSDERDAAGIAVTSEATRASSDAADDRAAGRTLPEEFATARDVRVDPGPGGFAPIAESPVRSAVPGQREGSAQQCNTTTATPGMNR